MASNDDYEHRRRNLAGTAVGLATYAVGEQYVCTVDEHDSGVFLARGEGRTRTEAEQAALAAARARMESSRRLQDTLTELRTRVAALDKRLSEPPPKNKA
jgi:hypothetical protein